MNYEREEYMRRQEAEHNMIRMRDQRAITRGLDKKPFAYCCAEAGGRVEDCDCVRKDHGTALFKATCIIPNCRNRTPPSEPFCSAHRQAT